MLDIKCESHYPSVQATKSGTALKVVPKLLVQCAYGPEQASQHWQALHGLPQA
jgi:hypothetical protein